jgi:hypothetical protein
MSLNGRMRSPCFVAGCIFCAAAGQFALAQPTTDDEKAAEWKGTLDWSAQQPVPSGVQYFSGHLDLALDEDEDGALKGALTGNQMQKLEVSTCPSQTVSPGSVSARLTGKFARQQVTINAGGPSYTPPQMSPCPSIGRPPSTAVAIFTWPHFDEVLHSLKAVDEFNYELDREWTVTREYGGVSAYSYTIRYTAKMQRTEIWGVPRTERICGAACRVSEIQQGQVQC